MSQWIKDYLEQFGAFGVGVLMLLENVIPPIPSEVVMPWAGYSVSQGDMSFLSVVIAGSIGSFAGAMLWYVVAKWIGKDRLAEWVVDHGAWLTITRADIETADDWFEKWGGLAVFTCRMIPGIRTLISVPAGFAAMPIGRFSAFTAAGTILWTALLAGAGWWLGDNYGDLAGPLSWVSTLVVASLFVWWISRLIQQKKSRQAKA